MLPTLLLAVAAQAMPPAIPGRYRAVTETEYAIELDLQPSRQARIEFRGWEADDPEHPDAQVFRGRWSRSATRVVIRFPRGKTIVFAPVACLSYAEFGRQGCSPGLRLVRTNLSHDYGLSRFGLWRSDALRIAP